MQMQFGDMVTFTSEYRSCKPKTVDISMPCDEIHKYMEENDIDCGGYITCKTVQPFKHPKTGIYLGTTKIHTAIYYDYNCAVDVGVGTIPENYRAYKDKYIEVAEIRCKGISKSYFVPFDDLKVVTTDKIPPPKER